MADVSEVFSLLERRGDSQYGGEAVTQLEHALQAATLAEQENMPAELIVAALLHDVGHLLHHLPNDAPDSGIDDHHERSAGAYLQKIFPVGVVEPIRLHVAAKRYLCTTDEKYMQSLSQPSQLSLRLQGGLMTPEEVREFAGLPYCADALRLRRWDDAAKIANFPTPSLSNFYPYAVSVARR